jgi:pyrimidine operon attenuation protein/uracil phosphoribosyltransferase
MDAEAIARVLRRVASEIVERTRGAKHLGIVGIRRGGTPISNRLADEIRRAEGREIPVGTIEIAFYRDDAATALPDPKIGPSAIPFEIKGRDVVLVDDVLHTGRTVRAAIDCLLDYGRPRRVWLAVLFDRGGRELPVAPDFVGMTHEMPPEDLLDVIMDDNSEDRAIVRRGEARKKELGGEG